MFEDRKHAGMRLAQALESYRDSDALVLAIPRGGVEVGYEIASALHVEFSLLICRKLPYPQDPESGFGAIAEDGSLYVNEMAAAYVTLPQRQRIIEQQSEEIKRRIDTLRGGAPLPSINGRTVILTDDGIAMGSTMHAAVDLCRKQKAARIVVAVPVAGEKSVAEFSEMTDELVVLETPYPFYAVAQVYRRWYDVSDEEVLAIMQRPR